MTIKCWILSDLTLVRIMYIMLNAKEHVNMAC